LDCAVDHMGEERANRYLRKFYPWYIERLGGTHKQQAVLQAALQQAPSTQMARELFDVYFPAQSHAMAPEYRASGLFSVPIETV
ncbi:MAG TPA: hypothetical protein VME01_03640, partial [Solirubrobacteraceae bacterium]|nr:hypothetical protein [Solirubrobacteraceae bacterium]